MGTFKRKLMTILIGCMFLFPALATGAGEVAKLSGLKTADALIYSGKCVFDGVTVVTDGTNNVTMSVYDGNSNAGRPITPDRKSVV